MATLDRVRVALTGFPGAPGVATFYFLDVSTAIESLNTLWTQFANLMPPDVTINVARAGDQIDDTTGAITGSWLGGVTAPIVGTNAGNYAAPAGAMVRWTTSVVADGHRIKGRTFIVPAASQIFSSNGQLSAATVSNYQAALDLFVTAQSTSFVIWHRPRKARAAVGTHPALSAHPGSHALVTGSSVSPKVVVLRSRRD